jgi:hypothetical protein
MLSAAVLEDPEARGGEALARGRAEPPRRGDGGKEEILEA